MKNHTTGISVVVPYHSKSMKKGLEQAIFETGRAEIALPPEK